MSDSRTAEQEIRDLRSQVAALERRVQQREQALAVLNRRLLQLERGQDGTYPAPPNVGNGVPALPGPSWSHRLRTSGLSRTAPARRLYGLLRRLR